VKLGLSPVRYADGITLSRLLFQDLDDPRLFSLTVGFDWSRCTPFGSHVVFRCFVFMCEVVGYF